MRGTTRLLWLSAFLTAAGVAPACAQVKTERIDAATLARDVAVLAADSLEGRAAGTIGGERARNWLLHRFAEIGLEPIAGGFTQPFDLPARGGAGTQGVNLIGSVRGTNEPDRWIVVTAHYDHLGTRDGTVFNGADDNASGVSGLLALATWFKHNPPSTSMLFVAFDAEELGLRGARAFVDSPPVSLDRVVVTVNLDMIGRNDAGELYVAGTAHYAELEPIIDAITPVAPVKLLKGHDRPSARPTDDWTSASDHGAFHAVGIPFLYFGVEDHADYHRPTDDAERIQPEFHANAVETVRRVLERIDRSTGEFRQAP